MSNEPGAPTAFVSYSWDSDEHKQWVCALAERLRSNGVNAVLDQWECEPGDKLPAFMERAVRENKFVVVVCTPKFKTKSDSRMGGAGYETDMMAGEVFAKRNHRKFIPVLRSPDREDATPTWLSGGYPINLSGDPYSETEYRDLLDTLLGRRKKAPPIGDAPPPLSPPTPHKRSVVLSGYLNESPPIVHRDDDPDNFKPITIEGIVQEGVGKPRTDGTPGSALYPVPFRFSRRPELEWARLFIHYWDNPQEWTSMHRRGTARIDGDVVTLTQTTLEEAQRVHKPMLKRCLDFANSRYVAYLRKERETATHKATQDHEWKEQVRKAAGDFRIE